MQTKLRKVLITGGRSPAALELSRLLHSLGYQVFAAESIPFHLLRFSNSVKKNYLVPSPRFDNEGYCESLLKIISLHKIGLVVPVNEEIFYVSQLKKRVPKYCKILAGDFKTISTLHNKYLFTRYAKKFGLAFPPTHLITSNKKLDAFWNKSFIFKQSYSRYALNVIFPSDTATKPSISLTNPWLAQKYVNGKNISTFVLAKEGKIISYACYYSEHVWKSGAMIYFKVFDYPAAHDWTKKLIKNLKYSGPMGLDFITTDTASCVAIECNPRFTSGIHLLKHDTNLHKYFNNNKVMQTKTSITPMISTMMLVLLLKNIFNPSFWRKWYQDFFSAEDVIFSKNDMLPWLLHFLLPLYFKYLGIKSGMSTTEATANDIAFNHDIQ